MAKLTKKAKSLTEKLGDNQKMYGVAEAIKALKDLKATKFDETLEVSLNLGVDPRHADQMVRGMVVLPSGTGKDVKVAVFARGENAEKALALREQGLTFDAIVSDIEMPGISGFELASMIKADDRWGDTPIVAISAHGTAADFEQGRKVGFSDYVVKMDRGALLRSLTETLSAFGDAA